MTQTRNAALAFLLFCSNPIFGIAQAQPTKEPPSQKDERKEAGKHFQKGVELYAAGDLRAALIEFKRAYEKVPTYHVLYNIAQVAAELREYVEAHDTYQKYLVEGKGRLSEERRIEVEEQVSRLAGYLATIEISVSVDGAEVALDGRVVGTSPLGDPITVSAGRRKVTVTHAGYAPWKRSLDLAGKDEERLQVTLIALASAPKQVVKTPIQPVERPTAKSRGMGTGFWVSVGATTALAAGTGYLAYRTKKAQDDYDKELATVPTTANAIDAAAQDVRDAALLTDIGLAMTAAGLVSTVLFAIIDDEREDFASANSSAIQIHVAPGNMTVMGRF